MDVICNLSHFPGALHSSKILIMAEKTSDGAYDEVFEDAPDSRTAQTIQHIRANSTIMQLKKILGEGSKPSELGKGPVEKVMLTSSLVISSCKPWRDS